MYPSYGLRMARQSVQVCLHGVCCSHIYLLHVPNESVYVVTDLANLSETNNRTKVHTHARHTHHTPHTSLRPLSHCRYKVKSEARNPRQKITSSVQKEHPTPTAQHTYTHTHTCTPARTPTHTYLCSVPYKSYAPSAAHPLAAHKEHSTIQSAHVPTRPSMVAGSTLQSDCTHNHKHCKHLEGRRRNACLLLLQQSCQLGEGRQ